jgi:hypothetical protein
LELLHAVWTSNSIMNPRSMIDLNFLILKNSLPFLYKV